MEYRLKVVAGVLVVVLVVAGGWFWWQSEQDNQAEPAETSVVIDGQYRFKVHLADTPAKQVRGLSGTAHLDSDEGMYFPRDPEIPASFWMKDMLIPIDIIWIHQGIIIGIEHQVPVPEDGMTDGELPNYSPPGATDAVLEIAAGRSRELGIETGDSAVLQIENARMTD